MKKIEFFVFFILYLTSLGRSETQLGTELKAGVIDSSGNPYIVQFNTTIPKNSTVTIKPGTVFLFKAFCGLIVNGGLQIEGTEDNPVVFTSYNDGEYNDSTGQFPNAFDWNGITVEKESDVIHLSNFKVMYSVFGIKSNKEDVLIHNGFFKQNGQYHLTINGNIQYVQDNVYFSYDKSKTEGKKGDLNIVADMEGCTIEIDGNVMEGVTPLTIKDFPVGVHNIVVRKGDYFGSETVKLTQDDLLKIQIKMAKGKRKLKIFSNPPGTRVIVDSIFKGVTPLIIENLSAKEHSVHVEKQGYITQGKKITVNVNEVGNVNFTLFPAAYITVQASQENAVILINGQQVDTGAIKKYAVPIDSVRLQVKAPGYEVYSKTLFLTQGEGKKITVELVPQTGTLTINTEPEGALLFVNSQLTGATPHTITIDTAITDNCIITLKKNNYKIIQDTIPVNKDSILVKEYTLTHTKHYADSIAVIKTAFKKKIRNIRRIVFGALSVGFFSAGIVYNAKMNSAEDTYYLYKGEDVNKHNKNWEKVEDYKKYRNVMYGIAGACTVGLGISLLF